MQHSFVQKTAARIAARNDPQRIRVRLTLGFCLWYLAAFVCGLLLCRATAGGLLPTLYDKAAILASPFEGCRMARDYIRAVLRESGPHLVALVLMALSGMTLFSPTASRIVLAVHALLFGIACYGTAHLVMTGVTGVSHPSPAFFACFFAGFCISTVLIDVACEADIFSYAYRNASRDLRSRRDTLSIQYLFHMLSAAGTIILLTAAWAVLTIIWK